METVNAVANVGHRFRLADDLTALGHTRMMSGDHQGARPALWESLQLLIEDENLPLMVTSLYFYAVLAGAELRESIGGAPATVTKLDDPTPVAREAIGDEAVNLAVGEVRAMDLDKAVDYALEEPPA